MLGLITDVAIFLTGDVAISQSEAIKKKSPGCLVSWVYSCGCMCDCRAAGKTLTMTK